MSTKKGHGFLDMKEFL